MLYQFKVYSSLSQTLFCFCVFSFKPNGAVNSEFLIASFDFSPMKIFRGVALERRNLVQEVTFDVMLESFFVFVKIVKLLEFIWNFLQEVILDSFLVLVEIVELLNFTWYLLKEMILYFAFNSLLVLVKIVKTVIVKIVMPEFMKIVMTMRLVIMSMIVRFVMMSMLVNLMVSMIVVRVSIIQDLHLNESNDFLCFKSKKKLKVRLPYEDD